MFYVKKNIVGRMKSQIKNYLLDCFNIGELFQCLDAQNSYIYEAVLNLKEDLNKLPSLPEGEAQENKNIQKIIRFIRILRKNKMNLPFNFASDCANKLSKENCMRIIEMQNKNSDLDDIESFSKLLYKIQAVNVQMMATSERLSPVVTTREKTLVAPKKKIIKSKLSRIRKRFYLTRDENTAVIYQREVDRYVRNFKMTPHEQNGWKKKIEQTYNDVKPLVDKEENPQDDENDENLTQSEEVENNSESEEVENNSESEEVKNDSKIAPQDEGEEAERLCLPEVPESDSEVEEEMFLPSVPQENPGDQDDDLHRRLKRLKKKERRSTPIQSTCPTISSKGEYEKTFENESTPKKFTLSVVSEQDTTACGSRYQSVPARPVRTPQYSEQDVKYYRWLDTQMMAPVTRNTLLPRQKNNAKDLTTNVTQKTPGNDEETTYLDEAIQNDMNKNIPQQVLFLLLLMMMMLTESVKKMNGRINQPPAKCYCDCYRKTAEVLPAERLAEFPLWLDLKVRAVLWIQSRVKNTLIWTNSFLEKMPDLEETCEGQSDCKSYVC